MGQVLVKSPSDFKPGDHGSILCRGYEHHFIVKEVLRDRIRVVEFGGASKKDLSVRDGEYDDFKRNVFFNVQYGACYQPEKTIAVAKCLTEHVQPGYYNLFSTNCEHLASFCKCGWGRSMQIETVKEIGFATGFQMAGVLLYFYGVTTGTLLAAYIATSVMPTAVGDLYRKLRPLSLRNGVASIDGVERVKIEEYAVKYLDGKGEWKTYWKGDASKQS